MINSKTKITDFILHEVEWEVVDEPKHPGSCPLPKHFWPAVRHAAKELRHRPCGHCWATLRFWSSFRGKPLERIYALRLFGKKKDKEAVARIQLIYAGIPGGQKWSSGNLLQMMIAGYVIQWDDRRTSYSYRPKPDYTMYERYDNDYRPSIHSAMSVQGTTLEEFLKLKGLPKGFKIIDGGDQQMKPYPDQWMAYIVRWEESKFVEPLVKMGFGHLWNDTGVDRLKSRKTISETVAYMKRNRKEIIDMHIHFATIRKAMKLGLTPSKYIELELFKTYKNVLREFGFDDATIKEIVRYVNRQNGGLTHYRDYLLASVEIGREITDRGVLSPKDFCKQFDEIQNTLKEIRAKKASERIAAAAKALGECRNITLRSGFQIIVPESFSDLIELGNALHNCVGTCGYGEMMADGSIVILAVYKDGKPVSCVEVAMPGTDQNSARTEYKTPTVVQNRGDHNGDVPEEVSKAVNTYLTRFKEAYRKAGAAA